jgi:hypothetical protein
MFAKGRQVTVGLCAAVYFRADANSSMTFEGDEAIRAVQGFTRSD